MAAGLHRRISSRVRRSRLAGGTSTVQTKARARKCALHAQAEQVLLRDDSAEVVARQDAEEVRQDDEPGEDRFLVVGLIAIAYVIWQMDKVNLSVAILPMATQYGWDAADIGLIQSSIFWGYAATTILGGVLAKQFGGKRVLLFAVVLFSTATILGPSAASVSTQVFTATRVLVGIGEGLAPGAALTLVASWIPASERSRAIATLGSGKNAGSIVGLLLAPLIISAFGWQSLFFAFGSLGLLWALVWAFNGKDREVSATRATSGRNVAPSEEQEEPPVPWQRILTTPQLWGIVAAHFGHDWGGYALLTWTPKFLNEKLGYDLQGSSQLTILPGLFAVGVAALGSSIADGLLKDGTDLTDVRKLMQGLGFLLPCVCIGALGALGDGAVGPGSPLPVALIVGGVATSALSYSGLYASHADLSKKYSGVVSGISTTFGALAGVGSNAFAGYALKATGSWAQSIFLPAVVFYLVGGATYQVLYNATPIDWDAAAEDEAVEGASGTPTE